MPCLCHYSPLKRLSLQYIFLNSSYKIKVQPEIFRGQWWSCEVNIDSKVSYQMINMFDSRASSKCLLGRKLGALYAPIVNSWTHTNMERDNLGSPWLVHSWKQPLITTLYRLISAPDPEHNATLKHLLDPFSEIQCPTKTIFYTHPDAKCFDGFSFEIIGCI